jgi:GntR family transcriptional repressor for pyruvate dehydrogenase complex
MTATEVPANTNGATATKSSRASERVANELACTLLHARFPEGTVLSPEGELMKALGCSRTALRGALRLLEGWGLISVQPGRNGGPVTRRPRSADLRPPLATLIHSREASLADLLTARRAIDPLIAAEAATHRTEEQAILLRSTITTAYEGIGSRDVFATANATFHRVLAEAAGLVVLGAFLSALTSIGDGTVHRITPNNEERRLRVIRAHEKVVEAIERSDPRDAETAMLAYQLEAEVFFRQFAPHLVDTPLRPLAFLDP